MLNARPASIVVDRNDDIRAYKYARDDGKLGERVIIANIHTAGTIDLDPLAQALRFVCKLHSLVSVQIFAIEGIQI